MILPVFLLAGVQEPVSESVVTAPRAGETVTQSEALVTTVTGEELEATGERSLPRALKAATNGGVWIQETNLGGGSPFVRGLTGNRILIIVDGVRVNDGTTRLGPNQSLNGIDPATVDRIEITRGPASVIYGSDAIGGVVAVWTKRRAPLAKGADGAEFDAGVAAQYVSVVDGGNVTLDGSLATSDVGALAIGTFFDFDDLESGGGTVPFTGYDGTSFFGSFEVPLGGERELRFTASVHKDFDVPRTDRLIVGFGQTQPAADVFEFSLQDRRRWIMAYTDRSRFALADVAQVRASYRIYTERRRRRNDPTDPLRFEEDEVRTGGLGVDFQKALGEDQVLTYGLDVELDDVDSTRTDLDVPTGTLTEEDGAFAPDARYVRSGVFVQDEIFFPWFDATVGARYSYYDFAFDPFGGVPGRESGDFDAFTASLQLARDLAEDVRLTGTLAQGFRAPNLDDLANNGSFAGGDELANPDLDPEESWSVDLAVDAAGDGWSGGASVFYTEIDDVIGRELLDPGDPTMTGDETYLRQNTGRVEIYGVEGLLRRRLGGQDSPFFGVVSATFTKGRQFDDVLDPGDGRTDARRIPPLFGRAALEIRPTGEAWPFDWADVELLWADDQGNLNPQDRSDPRIDPEGTPGWGVLNLDAGGRLGGDGSRSSWHAGLHNVFDKEYRVHASGFDAPGRGVVFGVEWRP